MIEAETPDIVEQASPLPFDATLERLTQAIEKAALTIFARIDHAANARGVGMTMPPSTVLVYGAANAHSALATPTVRPERERVRPRGSAWTAEPRHAR